MLNLNRIWLTSPIFNKIATKKGHKAPLTYYDSVTI